MRERGNKAKKAITKTEAVVIINVVFLIGGCDGRVMQNELWRIGTRVGYWCESQRERDH
jgi:hypothetical protein